MKKPRNKKIQSNPVVIAGKTLDMSQFLMESYQEYAEETCARSTIAPEDGLSVVQRRVVQALTDVAGNKVTGSAWVIGHLIARYHPHGDSTGYHTAVRMAHTEASPVSPLTLVGYAGGVSDTMCAAMRYTSMGLSGIGRAVYFPEHLGKHSMIGPNHDGMTTELKLLPTNLPIGLLTTNSGIMVGGVTSYIAARPDEVFALTLDYLNHRARSIAEPYPLRKVISFLSGPDRGCDQTVYYRSGDDLKKWIKGETVSFYQLPRLELFPKLPGSKAIARIVSHDKAEDQMVDIQKFRPKNPDGQASYTHPGILGIKTYILDGQEKSGKNKTGAKLVFDAGSWGDMTPGESVSALAGYISTKMGSVWTSQPLYFDHFHKPAMTEDDTPLIRLDASGLLDRWFRYRFMIETKYISDREKTHLKNVCDLITLRVLSGSEDIRASVIEEINRQKKSETSAANITEAVTGILLKKIYIRGKKKVRITELLRAELLALKIPPDEIGAILAAPEPYIRQALNIRLAAFRWSAATEERLSVELTEYAAYRSLSLDESKRVLHMRACIEQQLKPLVPKTQTRCVDMSQAGLIRFGNWIWIDSQDNRKLFTPEVCQALGIQPEYYPRTKKDYGKTVTLVSKSTGKIYGRIKASILKPVLEIPQKARVADLILCFE